MGHGKRRRFNFEPAFTTFWFLHARGLDACTEVQERLEIATVARLQEQGRPEPSKLRRQQNAFVEHAFEPADFALMESLLPGVIAEYETQRADSEQKTVAQLEEENSILRVQLQASKKERDAALWEPRKQKTEAHYIEGRMQRAEERVHQLEEENTILKIQLRASNEARDAALWEVRAHERGQGVFASDSVDPGLIPG
jgi:hypothetical protein